MLQRILELGDEVIRQLRPRALRVIAASGSALPGELATKVDGPLRRRPLQPLRLDRGRLGDDRHARGPARRARAPPAARRAARSSSSTTRTAREVAAAARPGRIFVGNEMLFEGYTGGGNKDVIDGLMSTGDVGHFDEGGRLFVDGRDDEMIVSGGENVFPREVEDLLADHDGDRRGRGRSASRTRSSASGCKAFVVLREGDELDAEDELKAHVKANLAGYKVPREVVFLDELPRNATGKVLKRELQTDVRSQSDADGRRSLRWEAWPRGPTCFDLGRLRLTPGEGRRLELEVPLGDVRASAASATCPSPPQVPVQLDVSRMTGGGYSLRLRFAAELDRALHALPGAAPRPRRRRRARGRPARRRRGAHEPVRRRRGARPGARGRATRSRSRCPPRSCAARTAPGCARVRRGPQRGRPEHAPRGARRTRAGPSCASSSSSERPAAATAPAPRTAASELRAARDVRRERPDLAAHEDRAVGGEREARVEAAPAAPSPGRP